MKTNYTTKKMPVKEVPKGVVFMDSEENVFFRVADTKTDKGVVLAYVVEVSTLDLERGDAATNLDPEQSVTAYFE